MREALMFAYATIVDGRTAEERADVDAALIGAPLPSALRAQADRDARNIEAAVRAGARIVGVN